MQPCLPRAVSILDACNVSDFKVVFQVCLNDKLNRRSERRQKIRLEKLLRFGQNAREINPQFHSSPFDCTFNIVGSCCVRLHGFKLCATTPNNTQQHATESAKRTQHVTFNNVASVCTRLLVLETPLTIKL